MQEAIDSSIHAAVVPLATKEVLREAVARLATKEELGQGLSDLREELRRHMDVLAERLHDDVDITLEAIGMSEARLVRDHTETRERLRELIRTEAQHHVGGSKSHEELLEQMRQYIRANASEHAEILKKIEKVRTARAAKLEAKPRKKKAS
jgi:serine phosphatase RsbU (regulator of sigma subunit)